MAKGFPMCRRCILVLALFSGGMMGAAEPGGPEGRKRVDAEAVAKLPPPGTVAPASIAFTPDGKAVTYLKSTAHDSLDRVLWRAEVRAGAPPRVIARAPGDGDTDANVSPEEALRRERQRLRETGITQVARAEDADFLIAPLKGDVFVLAGEGIATPRQLTHTPAAEIDPKPSKGGKQVAYVREGTLYALEVASGAEARLSGVPADGFSCGLAEFMAQEEMGRSSGFWWSPDGKRLAYQETDERRIPLYSIVHQGDDAISVETHRYPFAGATNASVRVGVVAAEGGETRWLDIPGLGAGGDYLARVDWEGPGELLVQILTRGQQRLQLSRIDVETGRVTPLLEETSSTWVNLHDDLRVVPETGELLWSSERSGFRHLELYDRDGKLLRALTAGDWAVDAVVALDKLRREVWFTAGKESALEMHLYRVSLDGGPIVRLTQTSGMHKAAVAPDGGHFVDLATSRTTPPVTTLRDRDGKALAVLDDAGVDPRVAALRLEPPSLVAFEDRDGDTLHGAYYAPKSRVLGAKAPLVVITYGGPHVQLVADTWGLTADLFAQYLTGRGFAVWKADNRGSARRGHAFEAAIHRKMGTVEVRDQVDGVKFVGMTWPDEVDTTRVGVTGASYGGYMTLRCLTEAPETFHAGVALAPVTDWDGYDTCYTERYMGTPEENPEGYKAASVLARAGSIKAPLFVVHGMLDENVHFRHTARLASALIAAGVPFDLLPLPNERHSSRREDDRRYEIERRVRFFEKALGNPGGPR